jgi:predicted enzyme related to lactoylglutathione lyase
MHLDLAADDIEAAKKFYGSIFDWKFHDMPEMKWTGVDVGKRGVGGGIGQKSMPGQPTAWTPYVEVADVRETIAKAEKAGATIVVPHMPIGEMGFIGVFVDPQGATIGVWQQSKAAARPTAKRAAAKKAAPKKAAPKKAAPKKAAPKKAAPKKAAPKKATKKK